ncbi:hypothetical protein DAT35_11685 [Vitiosangium sp. GDMCC 1.1324]|nr:hypothetical protein DAT35_11685 [Vitiosangium sp. GDMCC 1.1324]
METVRKEALSDERIRELHAVANSLMAEDLEHFRVHALSNELVHVFRRTDTGSIVGFQFWKTAPIGLPRSRIILGGKLRILPEFRNRGLHLLSGLTFFFQNKLRHPRTRHYRLSIASLFGFVSITEALARYQLFEPRMNTEEGRALRDAFFKLAEESHFKVDEERGVFFVNIFMKPETLSRFSPDYFQRPSARAYATINPEFRTNGSYAGFWFRFTPDNLASLTSATLRKLLRSPGTGSKS